MKYHLGIQHRYGTNSQAAVSEMVKDIVWVWGFYPNPFAVGLSDLTTGAKHSSYQEYSSNGWHWFAENSN